MTEYRVFKDLFARGASPEIVIKELVRLGWPEEKAFSMVQSMREKMDPSIRPGSPATLIGGIMVVLFSVAFLLAEDTRIIGIGLGALGFLCAVIGILKVVRGNGAHTRGQVRSDERGPGSDGHAKRG